MRNIACDVAVIGGGPAGLAAAVAAKKEGAERVLVIERDNRAGGILQQCIHPGFGLKLFKKELTGPEYYAHFVEEAKELGVEFLFDAMVLELNGNTVVCAGSKDGITEIEAGAVVLAMGCRERTRANITIPGTRPAGVYTAGAAQRLMNRQNRMVGKKAVILGSGDIGMIMARRLSLEGAEVVCVVEIMDFLAGLKRNKVQCLDDFGIPLMLRHTVTEIVGKDRVEGVRIAEVDERRQPIKETEQFIECDTLLLSVGLIPENEVTKGAGIAIHPTTNGPVVDEAMQTSVPGVFAAGNVVHVNDLVDNVSAESATAGRNAARYAKGELVATETVDVTVGSNVRYVCPQRFSPVRGEKVDFYFRVAAPAKKSEIIARDGDKVLARRVVPYVNPGEMEHLSVETAGLTSLTVEVKEG